MTTIEEYPAYVKAAKQAWLAENPNGIFFGHVDEVGWGMFSQEQLNENFDANGFLKKDKCESIIGNRKN